MNETEVAVGKEVVEEAAVVEREEAAVEKEVTATMEKELQAAVVDGAETAASTAAEEAFSAEVGTTKSWAAAFKVDADDGSCKDTSAMEWATSITELGGGASVVAVAPPFSITRSSTPVSKVKVADAALNFLPALVPPLPARPEFCEALSGNALRLTAASIPASVKTLSSALARERVVL